MDFNSELDLVNAYNNGYQGSIYEPEHYEKFMASLPMPFFGQAAPGLSGSGKGKISLPFLAVEKLSPIKPFTERQSTGDCTTQGTLVKTANGKMVSIENIKIGDMVLDDENVPRRVTDTIKKKYTGKMVRLFIEGLPDPIEFTPDHKIDTYPGIEQCFPNPVSGQKRKNRRSRHEEKLPLTAGDLRIGNRVCVPWGLHNDNAPIVTIDLLEFLPELKPDGLGKVQSPSGYGKSVNRYIEIDEDFSWLYGLFLAEGSYSNANITWSLCSDEQHLADRIILLGTKIFGLEFKITTVPSRTNIISVSCYSKVLELLFKKLCTGNVYSKEVHELILRANYHVREACLKGWIDGDGHINTQQRNNSPHHYCSITGVTASRNLMYDMFSLSLSLKLRPTVFNRKKAKHQRVASTEVKLYGSSVTSLYPELEEKVASQSNLNKVYSDVITHGIASKIRKIEYFDVEDIDVYCLEVDVAHKFQLGYINCFNCVSHGTRNAVDITRAVEIYLNHEPEEFVAIGATEPIYGHRGHSGQGASCSRLAEFVSKVGGLLVRKNYPELGIDLTKYNASIGIKWGGRGVPENVAAEARKHQVKTVSRINSLDELRDALANGYGVNCCSSQGFSSTRDKDGFARASGSWSHSMCVAGYDDYSPRKGALILNSWGENWISGPMPAFGNIPKGGFMAELSVVERMIRAGGTFAFSNFDGFPAQDLTSLGFSNYL